MTDERLTQLNDELQKLAEVIIDYLAETLADTEECPFYTDEGCPRPTEKIGAYQCDDPNSRCDKATRRGTYGVECWKLWALLKSQSRLASTTTETGTCSSGVEQTAHNR